MRTDKLIETGFIPSSAEVQIYASSKMNISEKETYAQTGGAVEACKLPHKHGDEKTLDEKRLEDSHEEKDPCLSMRKHMNRQGTLKTL